MLIFLAWFIEREGEAAEGRAYVLFGRLRIPPVRYFLPGALFAGMATLALVWMSDFGAALILAFLFVTMLYAGFQSRTFSRPSSSLGWDSACWPGCSCTSSGTFRR